YVRPLTRTGMGIIGGPGLVIDYGATRETALYVFGDSSSIALRALPRDRSVKLGVIGRKRRRSNSKVSPEMIVFRKISGTVSHRRCSTRNYINSDFDRRSVQFLSGGRRCRGGFTFLD